MNLKRIVRSELMMLILLLLLVWGFGIVKTWIGNTWRVYPVVRDEMPVLRTGPALPLGEGSSCHNLKRLSD